VRGIAHLARSNVSVLSTNSVQKSRDLGSSVDTDVCSSCDLDSLVFKRAFQSKLVFTSSSRLKYSADSPTVSAATIHCPIANPLSPDRVRKSYKIDTARLATKTRKSAQQMATLFGPSMMCECPTLQANHPPQATASNYHPVSSVVGSHTSHLCFTYAHCACGSNAGKCGSPWEEERVAVDCTRSVSPRFRLLVVEDR
jgi:hypothetical protein